MHLKRNILYVDEYIVVYVCVYVIYFKIYESNYYFQTIQSVGNLYQDNLVCKQNLQGDSKHTSLRRLKTSWQKNKKYDNKTKYSEKTLCRNPPKKRTSPKTWYELKFSGKVSISCPTCDYRCYLEPYAVTADLLSMKTLSILV